MQGCRGPQSLRARNPSKFAKFAGNHADTLCIKIIPFLQKNSKHFTGGGLSHFPNKFRVSPRTLKGLKTENKTTPVIAFPTAKILPTPMSTWLRQCQPGYASVNLATPMSTEIYKMSTIKLDRLTVI